MCAAFYAFHVCYVLCVMMCDVYHFGARDCRNGEAWVHREPQSEASDFPQVSHGRQSMEIFTYPPTPAFAKAGAAPGTTAGVELVFLSFKCPNASRQLGFAAALDQHAVCLHSPTPQAKASRPHQWLLGAQACRLPACQRFQGYKSSWSAHKWYPSRPDQWLLLGVHTARLPRLQRLQRLKP